jgi:hypothetical protein
VTQCRAPGSKLNPHNGRIPYGIAAIVTAHDEKDIGLHILLPPPAVEYAH